MNGVLVYGATGCTTITGEILRGNVDRGFQVPSRHGRALLQQIPGVEWLNTERSR